MMRCEHCQELRSDVYEKRGRWLCKTCSEDLKDSFEEEDRILSTMSTIFAAEDRFFEALERNRMGVVAQA